MSTIKSSAENLTLNADGANNDIKFQSNGSEVASIDQAGSLVLAGAISSVGAGANASVFNRTSSDGTIVDLKKDGTTVGSIGVASGVEPFFVGATAGGFQISHLNSTNAVIIPVTATGASSDATHDIGYSGKRFKDLVLSGGLKVGGTGAANTLSDYETGTWTPALSGVTGSFNTSGTLNYTKVGRIVTLNGYIYNCTSISNTSAAWQFSGLPFAPIQDVQAAVALYNVDFTVSNSYVTIRANANNSSLVLIESRDANTSIQLSFAAVGGGHAEFTMTYATNA